MAFVTKTIRRETTEPVQVIDITVEVKEIVANCGITEGQLTVISQHTTAFVNINEQEPRLMEDMVTFLKRLVPRDGNYAHNIAPVDGRDNAHSHLMGLFMNTSETIPFSDGELMLGTWQSVFLIELDGPRKERKVLLHLS
ncbi:MAG: secondary thiamine-phosphate synthase enzyme YjbQ [Prosthecochloris sp.]|nr:secondary thiamine-phosphate synthase enzyme YjbQ [Prosthecochloris sp.]